MVPDGQLNAGGDVGVIAAGIAAVSGGFVASPKSIELAISVLTTSPTAPSRAAQVSVRSGAFFCMYLHRRCVRQVLSRVSVTGW
jgi:hypothetical protein